MKRKKRKALTAYEQAFDDALAVRVLSVPPVSVENMVIYVREKLQSVGAGIDSGCEYQYEGIKVVDIADWLLDK